MKNLPVGAALPAAFISVAGIMPQAPASGKAPYSRHVIAFLNAFSVKRNDCPRSEKACQRCWNMTAEEYRRAIVRSYRSEPACTMRRFPNSPPHANNPFPGTWLNSSLMPSGSSNSSE
jgi:hypothetical protein